MPFKYYIPKGKINIPQKGDEPEQSDNPFLPNYKHQRKDYYPPEFYALRPVVIKRYEDRCFMCGVLANEIHHVDYNRMNNNINNLCLLCKSCHQKTNFGRAYWQEFLTKKIREFFKNFRKEDNEL